MKTQSAKAKGRSGQQEIRDKLLETFKGKLTENDIRSTAMGQNGVDLLLSPLAYSMLPIAPEIKRRKSLKTLYDWYDQASQNEGHPVVFMRGDYKPWLVTISLDYFLELVSDGKPKSIPPKGYKVKPLKSTTKSLPKSIPKSSSDDQQG